ncbi:methionyl-tRNA formyltransferase [candidate division CSSED10-310 bacterium]|uniref:Methionyl-tRNA formyltransferase n=1 Tax=candidate division CSSED10-310 bacterium TaxID=2855610 RepID=A0ABV6Z571_UNCC1
MTAKVFNIVFMGTPEFAVPTLEKIITETAHHLIGVITQPDRPKGRGLKKIESPVKKVAVRYGIPVLQPEKLRKSAREWLHQLQPDLIVVVAYGKILSKSILQIPAWGCINVHASLLPLYRGAAPINWALIKGETVSGITTMLMDPGMDTGDILLQEQCHIAPHDTAETLHDSLAVMGATLLLQTLQKLSTGDIEPQKQNEALATYAPLLKKEDGRLNWLQNSHEIYNFIRGLYPWPGAFTFYKHKRVKVLQATLEPAEQRSSHPPGSFLEFDKKQGLRVATGSGSLWINKLQPESKGPLSARDFYNGYRCQLRDCFTP